MFNPSDTVVCTIDRDRYIINNLKSYLMKLIKFIIVTVVLCSLYLFCDKESFSNQKKILTFEINSIKGVINEDDYTINVELPFGTDVTSLKPVIRLSEKASIYPQSKNGFDFSTPITFIVTAEDDSNQDYRVTVLISDKK